MEVGFSHGIPENPDKTWKRERDCRYTFVKLRKKDGQFLYYCQRSKEIGTTKEDLSTGFETDRDLTPAEVESRQQFIDFIEGTR